MAGDEDVTVGDGDGAVGEGGGVGLSAERAARPFVTLTASALRDSDFETVLFGRADANGGTPGASPKNESSMSLAVIPGARWPRMRIAPALR